MADVRNDRFGAWGTFETGSGKAALYRLSRLEEQGLGPLSRLPYSLRILLENLLRHCDGRVATEEDVRFLAGWRPGAGKARDIGFMPARVVLQDFTGVPAVVDLAAMRSATKRLGADPKRINPLIPVDLVIDHSVQVDFYGNAEAFFRNVALEFERNHERYALLRWAQKAFDNFRVVPPGTGIVHQVNLEYLGQVVQLRSAGGENVAFPDTLVGTDSHTTMINGLGILGWGVGGIEAEAVMLGQPYFMLLPEVVGFRLVGQLPEGATPTDLVLTVTQMLRKKGVVGKFVEFYGPGLSNLSLADRATIGNMAPEYGATMGFFPVDQVTLNYLRGTGRPEEQVRLVERYCKEQGLFRTDGSPEPEYDDRIELDMSTVEPCLAGPRRPQDRVLLRDVKTTFLKDLEEYYHKDPAAVTGDSSLSTGAPAAHAPASSGNVAVLTKEEVALRDGAVVIAAITSCTNTSNPTVMVAAGLLARKAVERGLAVKPYVKTSLAPGSRVVTDYLQAAGLMPDLEALGFHVVGYGCTTCIGNSGQVAEGIAQEIREKDLVVASVLSGNRNFEGRINPLTKLSYLASPPLVVAYALAGRVDIEWENEPIGADSNGKPVFLRDLWPSQQEVRDTVERSLKPEMFRDRYAEVFTGDEQWRNLPVPEGDVYRFDEESTYIQEPPFFQEMPPGVPPVADIQGARALAVLGDSITTDHISPAGSIPKDSPAGKYLIGRGVKPVEFNSYGARRGNHEVMVRGTFGNIRLRNQLVPGTEGGWTKHIPSGEKMTIFDAAVRYEEEGIPLLIIAGKEYGSGSSRDWAAKGPFLQGVKAVLAESYERIHRSNLIGMGVLPLEFRSGANRESLGLDGTEAYDITGIEAHLKPGDTIEVRARKSDGRAVAFQAVIRLDTEVEIEYYRNAGILQTVLRKIAAGN